MGEKYLSDVIDFNRDIEPYRIIRIYSGVGSGKNTWVESLVNEKHYSVLLITSRRATASAQKEKLNADGYIDIEAICKTGFGEHKQKKCVVTNAQIQYYLENQYKEEEERTHIWKFFDFIILDEAHSLTADATFSDSPFYVKSFLKWVQTHDDNNCRLIFMTGTPEPIDYLFSNKTCRSEIFNNLDLFDECKHIDPEEVWLYPTYNIEKDIVYEIDKGKRIIYFANSITRMEEMVKTLIKLGLDTKKIGIAYSGNKERNFPKEILSEKAKIRQHLLSEERIPSEIKIFLTTSQNKEGVNIKDDDIKIMISESHERSSLIQMAGRVRNGLELLAVIYDAKQHSPSTSTEEMILDKYCLNEINEFWINNPDWNTPKMISLIHDKFPSIRYDYLRKSFAWYSQRWHGFEQAEEDEEYLRECMSLSYDSAYVYLLDNGEYGSAGQQEFQAWFRYSEVEFTREMRIEVQAYMLYKEVDDFIRNGEYWGREITKEEKKDFLDKLDIMIADSGYNHEKMSVKFSKARPSRFLEKCGFCINDPEGKRKNQSFIIERTRKNK